MVDLRGEELWVAACVEAALTGVDVRQHDDGSTSSMYDLGIWRSGDRVGAMEVTAAADPQVIEQWNLINGSRQRWIEPALAGGWMVTLRPGSRIKRLRSELPKLLAALERTGVTQIEQSSSRQVADLGIIRAGQGGTDFPGSIYVTVELPRERSGGWIAPHSNALPQWLSKWTATPEQMHNISKLSDSKLEERHLFVLFPGFSDAPFAIADLLMRDDAPVPTDAPSLPEGLTHVWAMSTWTSGRGFYWSQATDWTAFAKVFEIGD